MKKNILAAIATLTLATALTTVNVSCANSGNKSGKKETPSATFHSSENFFALSAASGVSFLDGAASMNQAAAGVSFLKGAAVMNHTAAAIDTLSVETPATRPSEFTDEDVKEINNTLVMFDSIVGSDLSAKTDKNDGTDEKYSVYEYKMTISFGGKNAVMYYNETDLRTETDHDDEETETGTETETETETEATLEGVLVSDEYEYSATGMRKEETSADETEYELELIVKKSETTFVKFSYGTETESTERETEYKCEIYENGKKIQKTKIEFEEENGQTEIKFKLEKNGNFEGAEYKIVKRSDNKYDIRREQNGKKTYILAEKTEQGYKFTYSNGFSEIPDENAKIQPVNI